MPITAPTGDPILVMIVVLSCIFCYLIPSYIARKNGHKYTPQILIINLFFGWLVLPWIAALVWAALPHKKDGFISHAELQTLRKCPFCYELVKKEAIKCKHCTADLVAEVEYPE